MPHLPSDTRTAFGAIPAAERSRSLHLTRYAEPQSKEKQRADFFTAAFKLGVATPKDHAPLVRWMAFLTTELGIPAEKLVFGRLLSRLALHLSGGVMENAGILLDRFGYPYIPGSGVKGIARHAGLFALREWTQSNTKPSSADNPLAKLCEPYQEPATLAADLLRVFGWVDQDWKDSNDIQWALSGQLELIDATLAHLAGHPGTVDSEDIRKTTRKGIVTFLDARPVHNDGVVRYPANGTDLELDVLTPHHKKYYAEDERMPVAFDSEDPTPVVFPTVAAGVVFVFSIRAAEGTQESLETLARRCLVTGITTFGASAKTAAGYGWFEVDFDRTKPPAQPPVVASTGAQPPPAVVTVDFDGDYTEATFKGAILDVLGDAGSYSALQKEIEKLKKPANAKWVGKLKDYLASTSGNDARKKLKAKDWFPKEWLSKG